MQTKAEIALRAKKHYDSHKAEFALRHEKYYDSHKAETKIRNKEYAVSHRPERSIYRKKYTWKVRCQVMKLLGGECRRCGMIDIRALQVNHINGDGHNDAQNKTTLFYAHILKGLRSRDDLELLCANCNLIYEYEQGRKYQGEQ